MLLKLVKKLLWNESEQNPSIPTKPIPPPKTAYFLFDKENRSRLKTENPDLKGHAISRKIGEEWKNMDANKKRKFKKRHTALWNEYEEKLKLYENWLMKQKEQQKSTDSQEWMFVHTDAENR